MSTYLESTPKRMALRCLQKSLCLIFLAAYVHAGNADSAVHPPVRLNRTSRADNGVAQCCNSQGSSGNAGNGCSSCKMNPSVQCYTHYPGYCGSSNCNNKHLKSKVCATCYRGFKYNAAAMTCEPCPSNEYQSSGALTCPDKYPTNPYRSCSRVYGWRGNGNTLPECIKQPNCTFGEFISEDSKVKRRTCHACPVGQYQDEEAHRRTACLPCGTNETSLDHAEGAASCMDSSSTTTSTTVTGTTTTSLPLHARCDPRNDVCDEIQGLMCNEDHYECRYGTKKTTVTTVTATTTTVTATTTTTTLTYTSTTSITHTTTTTTDPTILLCGQPGQAECTGAVVCAAAPAPEEPTTTTTTTTDTTTIVLATIDGDVVLDFTPGTAFDAAKAKMAGVGTVDGDLTIIGTDVDGTTMSAALANLKIVTDEVKMSSGLVNFAVGAGEVTFASLHTAGGLKIGGAGGACNGFTALVFSVLESVTVGLNAHGLYVGSCPDLTKLSAPALKQVSRSVDVINNPKLTTVEFPSLVSSSGDFTVNVNPLLSDISISPQFDSRCAVKGVYTQSNAADFECTAENGLKSVVESCTRCGRPCEYNSNGPSSCLPTFPWDPADDSSIFIADNTVAARAASFLPGKIEEVLGAQYPADATTWKLLYRGTRDGFESSDFHSKCDNQGATVTVVKSGSYVFGGVSAISWASRNAGVETPAFLYGLRTSGSPDDAVIFLPTKNTQNAILDNEIYGPTFGSGNDLRIATNADTTSDSYSDLGHTYTGNGIAERGTEAGQTYFAGSYAFQVDEIEVFQIVPPPISTAGNYEIAKWEAGAPMRIVNQQFGMVLIPSTNSSSRGHVMVAGGKDAGSQPLSSVYMHDVDAGTWSGPAAAMPIARTLFGMVHIPSVDGVGSGHVMVAGGQNNNGYLDSVYMYDVEADAWAGPATAMPVVRTLFGMVHIPSGDGIGRGHVMVTGGWNGSHWLDSVYMYDVDARVWSGSAAAMPVVRGMFEMVHIPSADGVGRGQVMVAGGSNGKDAPHRDLDSVYMYNADAGTWSGPAAALPIVRYGFGMVYIPSVDGIGRGHVMVAGGVSNGNYLDSVYMYDVNAELWIGPVVAMQVALHYFGMVHIPSANGVGRGQVMVAGGYSAAAEGLVDSVYFSAPVTTTADQISTAPSPKIYVTGGNRGSHRTQTLNGVSTAWEKAPDMTTGRKYHAMAVFRGLLFALGGVGPKRSVESFDGVEWSAAPSMINARFNAGVAVYKSALYVTGGEASADAENGGVTQKPVRWVERFDGTEWVEAPEMTTERYAHVSLTFQGQLYAIGGARNDPDGSHPPVATVERFDGDSWNAAPSMITAREDAAGAVFQGSVYITGGESPGGYAASVERFDGINWFEAPEMSQNRAHHAVVVFGNLLYAIAGDHTNYGTGNGPVYKRDSVETFNGTAWVDAPPLITAAENELAAAVFPQELDTTTTPATTTITTLTTTTTTTTTSLICACADGHVATADRLGCTSNSTTSTTTETATTTTKTTHPQPLLCNGTPDPTDCSTKVAISDCGTILFGSINASSLCPAMCNACTVTTTAVPTKADGDEPLSQDGKTNVGNGDIGTEGTNNETDNGKEEADDSATAKSNVGLIVGIVLAFLLIGIAVAVFVLRKKEQGRQRSFTQSRGPPARNNATFDFEEEAAAASSANTDGMPDYEEIDENDDTYEQPANAYEEPATQQKPVSQVDDDYDMPDSRPNQYADMGLGGGSAPNRSAVANATYGNNTAPEGALYDEASNSAAAGQGVLYDAASASGQTAYSLAGVDDGNGGIEL